jgi:ribosomal protein S18 acetylase RimI-like enzyme
MTIRNTQESDLLAIAGIHKAQFASHFLGQYSPTLLACYYRTFLDKDLWFLVHESEGIVDGFILGGEDRELDRCRTAFLHRNVIRCLWETLVRPSLWFEAVRRTLGNLPLTRRRTQPDELKPLKGSPFIDVVSIAVSPSEMGKGVAAMLITAFEQAIQAKHVQKYGLFVMRDNVRACRFYQKNGFQVADDSGVSLFLIKKLTPPAG